MENLILQTNDLSFKYKNELIVKKINLKVEDSSIYGFLGKNGAGKSTTIKLLTGLLPPKKGEVFLFNKDLHVAGKKLLSKIGCIIESPAIYEHLSAFDNLNYLNIIYELDHRRIDEVLSIVGLFREKDKKVKDFSLGMKQRLAIGMAIFHDPSLLILDEPINGLDPSGVAKVRSIILDLNKMGKTIIVSSHILSEIEKICSHIGILNKGEVIYQGEMNHFLGQTIRKVKIRTSDNHHIINLLQNESYELKLTNDYLSVAIKDDMHFDRLIWLIQKNSVQIYDIEKDKNTLEDYFFKTISNTN